MGKSIGKIIIPPDVLVSVHEKLTADFLASSLGLDVLFILPDRRPGQRTPDIWMDGRFWEIKSPRGSSSRTIENNLRAALKQSSYIVIDLRRMSVKVPEKSYVNEISRQFTKARSIERIIVITRYSGAVDFIR